MRCAWKSDKQKNSFEWSSCIYGGMCRLQRQCSCNPTHILYMEHHVKDDGAAVNYTSVAHEAAWRKKKRMTVGGNERQIAREQATLKSSVTRAMWARVKVVAQWERGAVSLGIRTSRQMPPRAQCQQRKAPEGACHRSQSNGQILYI